MAKINLLPPELGGAKKTVPFNLNIQGLPVFLLSLSLVFFLAGIYLRLEMEYRKKGLKRIVARYQQAEVMAKKIKGLKQEQERLNQKLNLLNGYLKRDVLWSEKLSQLRNLIPQEIWLRELSFEKKSADQSGKGSLYLKGSLIPQEKTSPIGTLSSFINQLKEDKAFFIDFDNPILTDLKTNTQKNIEIMTFAIQLPFKAN